MKLKPHDREWAEFAIRNRHNLKFTGSDKIEFPSGGTLDGLRAFKIQDSNGKIVPTRHPNIARCLHTVKAAVTLQIKQWVECLLNGTFFWFEMDDYFNEIGAPQWIRDALRTQYEANLHKKDTEWRDDWVREVVMTRRSQITDQ